MPSWHEPNRRPWPLILGLIAGVLIALTIAAGQAYAGEPRPDPHPSAGAGPIRWWSYYIDRPLYADGRRVQGVKLRCYVPARGQRHCRVIVAP